MPPGIYQRKGHTDETRRRIAAGNTGKVFSQERKDAISRANTKHVDPDLLEKIRIMLNEKVCCFDAVLKELGTKPGRVILRNLAEAGIRQDHALKFFNHAISYQDGKRFLAYLRLNIHPREIQARLNIGQKTFAGSAAKLQIAHNFKYAPVKLQPGGDRKQTKPERQTCDILDSLSVSYTREYSFGNFYYDIHITGTNLFVEVQGDYWHANPSIYNDVSKLTSVQKTNVRRDHYKRRFARENGFYTLYIWENDLKTRATDVTITLENYTKRAYAKAADFNILQGSGAQLQGDGIKSILPNHWVGDFNAQL